MEDRSEVIKQEMEETRADLTDKLQTLERKVADEFMSVKDTVTDSVTNVAENVEETITSVREAFDLPGYVREHPWMSVGGAVLVGYLAHEFLKPNIPAASGGYSGNGQPRAQEGLLSMLGKAVGDEWQSVQRLAARSALGLVEQAIDGSKGEAGVILGHIINRLSAALEEPQAQQQPCSKAGSTEGAGERQPGTTNMKW